MRRNWTALLLAALLLFSALPPARAAHAGYALVVNTSRLNIRSGPGTGYPIIGGVSGGQWVRVDATMSGWRQGQSLQDGTSGYFSSSFLRMASASGGTGSVGVVTTSSYLNLRQSPSYSAPVLGIFYNGTAFTVLGEIYGWYHVEVSGIRGYFKSEFVRISGGSGGAIGTARVYSSNGGSVNLRNAPTYASSVIGQAASGTTVSVYLKGTRFWYISLAGTFGFMDARFLTHSGGGTPPAPPPPDPGPANAVVTSIGSSLNLREQPSTTSRVIAAYPGGTPVSVRMQGVNWSRVYIPSSGKSGYMMTRFLTLYGLPITPMRTVNHPGGTYVNLRAQPRLTAAVILQVPHGSLVTILIAGGEWAQVKHESTTGYMMTRFLQ